MNSTDSIKTLLTKGLLLPCSIGLVLPRASFALPTEQNTDDGKNNSDPNITLQQVPLEESKIERVQIISRKHDSLSTITEDTEKLVSMPGAGGDPLRAIFALPGVVPAGGSMSEPSVRGASPSDNSFEVDFMPAGYIFHDFGNSIFSKYIVQDFRLFTAAFSPSFSNATGAVFDVALRAPKFQTLETTVDLTMFRAGIFLEGKVSENSAFYFSARKSTLPLFFDSGEELDDEDDEPSGITINDPPDDHDYQGKWFWQMSNNNSLTFSFTGAEDVFAAGISDYSEFALKSPEFIGDVIYERRFNGQNLVWDNYAKDSHLKVGLGYLNNKQRIDYGKNVDGSGFFQDYALEQYVAKARWRYDLTKAQSLVLDGGLYHINNTLAFDGFLYNCTEIDPDCSLKKGELVSAKHNLNYNQYYFGANHIWNFNEAWQSEIGLHFQANSYQDDEFLLPRMKLHYFMDADKTVSIKYGQYARMQDSDYIVPDIGNPALESQKADHYAISFSQTINDNWEWSVEPYYKTMENLPLGLASQPNSELLYSNDVSGKAYGVDLLVSKNQSDNWYGWVSLSYSKSERRNDLTNEKIDYYADTPLVFNMVFNYQISDLWQGGANFTLRSGQVYTPIVGVQQNPDFEDNFQPIYSEPFSDRFSPSHRLDIRFERKTNFWGLEGLLILEVVNAYGYNSPTSIDLDYKNIQSTDDFILKEEEEGLDIMPSVGFSLTF